MESHQITPHFLDFFSEEILLQILFFLDFDSLLILASVNKDLRSKTLDHSLWKKKIEIGFPKMFNDQKQKEPMEIKIDWRAVFFNYRFAKYRSLLIKYEALSYDTRKKLSKLSELNPKDTLSLLKSCHLSVDLLRMRDTDGVTFSTWLREQINYHPDTFTYIFNFYLPTYQTSEGAWNIEKKDSQAKTLLDYAIEFRQKEMTMTLIDQHPFLLNEPNAQGCMPLHLAALYGWEDIVASLLQKKANINIKNTEDKNALECAMKNKHDHVAIQLIQAGIETHDRKGHRLAALYLATTIYQREAVASALLEKNAALDDSIIYNAAKNGILCVLRKLADVDINKLRQFSDPPLNKTLLHYAVEGGHLETVNYLIQQGININATMTRIHFYQSMSALDLAIQHGYEEITFRLIEQNANVTALSLKLAIMRNFFEAVKIILQKKPFLLEDKISDDGYTPLLLAVEKNSIKITQWLLTQGAHLEATTTKGEDLYQIIKKNKSKEMKALLEKFERSKKHKVCGIL